MATERSVEEVFHGRDHGRQYFKVRQADADTLDMAADDDSALVLLEANAIKCYRCDRQADVEFKCIHIHAVRKTLDL